MIIARKAFLIGRVINQASYTDGAQEVASRLVITRGDGPALFELGKEVFDQIAGLVRPFRHLRGRWEFVATDDDGCEVRYSMDFEVPLLLAPILGGLMSHMSNTMVDAFARRAEQVYGA